MKPLVTEYLCIDCIEGDHEACRREGGWPHQDTSERCGCHLSAHRFDNRVVGLAGQVRTATGMSIEQIAAAIDRLTWTPTKPPQNASPSSPSPRGRET